MPRYSNLTKLTRVNGHMIPAKSTHYALAQNTDYISSGAVNGTSQR